MLHATDRFCTGFCRTDLRIDETAQPDLMLQMSTGGKIGVGGLILAAFVVLIVVGVVLYGLNASG
jgi:hypothetical protein